MQPDILYEEVQTFNSRLIELILKISIGVFLVIILIIAFARIEIDKNSAIALTSTAIIFWVISFILEKSRLITQIRTDGIYVRFPPLRNSFIIFRWSDIDKLFIRHYDPLKEYGGWGIRIGLRGTAYNVSGNTGLQLILKNNSKILIGTNDTETLAAVLLKIGKLDHYTEL